MVLFLVISTNMFRQSSAAEKFLFEKENQLDLSLITGGIALSQDDQNLFVAFWGDTSNDPIEWYKANEPYSYLDKFSYGRCHEDVVLSADERYLFFTTYYSGNVSRYDLVTGEHLTLPTTSWPAHI